MGKWDLAVQQMASFYASNVHTYLGTTAKPRRGRKAYMCPLVGHAVYDDCSGFTSACLLLFGAFHSAMVPTSGLFASTSNLVASNLRKAGFSPYAFNINALKPFDIIAMNGHVEIFAGMINGSRKSYSWGNIHDNSRGGLPSYYCKDPYVIIWRNNGVSLDTPINFTAGDSILAQMNNGYGTGGTFGGNGLNWLTYNNTANNYPVHSEYDTFSGTGGSVFELAENNIISFAYMDTSVSTISSEHTRIYSTNDSSMILDELAIPLDIERDSDVSTNDTSTN